MKEVKNIRGNEPDKTRGQERRIRNVTILIHRLLQHVNPLTPHGVGRYVSAALVYHFMQALCGGPHWAYPMHWCVRCAVLCMILRCEAPILLPI